MIVVQRRIGGAWLRDPQTLKLALHGMLTGIVAWLSLAFALPGDVFASPSFAEFKVIGTEEEWAAAFLLVALVGLIGLLTTRRWLCLLSIWALSTSHMSIAYCFFLGSQRVPDVAISPAVGVYGLIAVIGYLLLWVRVFEK